MHDNFNTLTVRDLIELLDDYDPDSPVLIAHQPGWPLAEVVAGVVEHEEARTLEDRDSDPDAFQPDPALSGTFSQQRDAAPILWLVAGGHPTGTSPYAPGWVFENLEVGR